MDPGTIRYTYAAGSFKLKKSCQPYIQNFFYTKEWEEAFISGELNGNELVDYHQREDTLSNFKTGLISFGCSASAPSFAWVPRQLDLVESFQFASPEICDPIEQWSFNSSRFFSILLSSQKLAPIWSCNQSRGPWVSTASHMPKRVSDP
jgi:hypothetical protein